MTKLILLIIALTSIAVHAFGQSNPAPSITVGWNASTGQNINGYVLKMGGASGIYTNAIAVGNTTNVTVTNITRGSTYFFVVTAINSSGLESLPSNEISWTVATPPAAPTNLRVIAGQ